MREAANLTNKIELYNWTCIVAYLDVAKHWEDTCNDEQDFSSRQAMRVGIVGAGISGVVAGAHLKAAGVLVTVFERSGEAGGVW